MTIFLKNNNNSFILSLIFLLLIVFCLQVDAQTLSVQGKVTASRYPVQNASVTFVDKADTTRKFSALTDASGNYRIGVTTLIESNTNDLPTKFELAQSYPNPFSSSTVIPYGFKNVSDVQVTIYDILGRVVRKFEVGRQAAGFHNVLWNGCNSFGKRVATGVYFYRLNVDGESQVKKMIFDQNGNGFVTIPHSFSLTENSSLAKANKTQNVQGSTFTIRIQNTSTTTPMVVPEEIENVAIKNDTTINLSVTYMPLATVNFDSLHQIIRGFGASSILKWRPDMTDGEIARAFGTSKGQLGFSILRIMVEADSNRWGLNIPTAKKAQDLGVTIIASPWHAPSEMLETVGTQIRIRYDMYDEYAAHLNSFNTYMKKNGVFIYGLSVQNEPDITGNDWTHWSANEMLTFMRSNANAIEGTKVMAPESMGFKREYSDPILLDSAACANTDIICGHIYGSGLFSYPLAEQKGKEVWMTEYLSGEKSQANDWSWALSTASQMNDVMQAGMSTYVWWYLVRYYGPISDGENNSGRKGEVTKKGYVMSQFARFIRPGYYRVESSVYPTLSKVRVTAYKDPVSSKVVIVAVNTGSALAVKFSRMQNGTMATTFTPYTTSVTKNCEQGDEFDVIGDNFSFTLESSSITTFVSN